MFNDVLFFYYNTDILKKAGFAKPPASWEEFVTMSQAIQAKKLAPYGSIWGWAQAEGLICYYTAIVHGFGGDLVDAAGNPKVDTPANVNARSRRRDFRTTRSARARSRTRPPSPPTTARCSTPSPRERFPSG